MNRTLLVEEGDDEGDNRQDKKKREKEKFPDTAEKKKKLAFKKSDGKKDIHHNNSLTSSSKVQPAEMADMAAVNPDAEGMTSPVGSPAGILPGTNVYQGNIVIPPPPRPVTLQQISTQHLQQRANWPQQQQQPQMTAVYIIPATQQPHFIPTPFQSPGPPPQQIPGQFVAQPYQQGHFAAPQYHQAGGTPVQGAVYSGQAVVVGSHHGHVLTRAQSLPSSATPEDEQAHSSGQPGWVARPSASPPPFNSAESSWAANPQAEPREERTWREGEHPANENAQWAAFSPDDPSQHANAWLNELDEEHSSSDEDVDRSSSPELAGEEGEVLLRAPSLASFAESISSLEEESEDNVWRILPEQREYYTKQFKRLQPVEDGVVKGPRARDFFMKSGLPVELLSKIWHLSDINKDNALNLAEFCIAMHLVVALRHGLELPSTLPTVLLPEKKEAEVEMPLEMPQQTEENEEHEARRRMSSPEHWLRFSESRSQDATSPPAKFTNSSVRRKAHSVVQPIPLRGDLQGDEDNAARPRSLSDPTSLEDATTDGLPHRPTNLDLGGPMKPLHIVMPQSPVSQTEAVPTSPSQAVSAEIEIARPRATVKPSLLDALPGQLLPPPSGKQARDGWTPTSKFIYQKDPTSPGPSSSPPSSPEEETPTSPLSPEGRKTPSPPLAQEIEEEERPKEDAGKEEVPVVYRVNRRSGERPRSTGDVKISNKNESSLPTTPVDEEGQSSVSSEGRRDPPPPPPRNKKGHSRSSSLDLNKLFATKAKENKGTPPSSSSSYSSQTGTDGVPPARSEPTTPRHRNNEKSTSDDKVEESQEKQGKVEKQEDFADFSRFESFVEAQESAREGRRGSSPRPGQHRRSFSLDHSREVVWSQPPRKIPSEAVTTTPSRPPHNQEALPRPVPKLKPPSPPTLKQGRRLDKDGEKERKLKTEPPKVVVRPLNKEDKLNSRIHDLKEKNAALSKVNSELQEEIKMIMERRATLEVKLEKLKSPSTTQKQETANN